MGGYTEFREYSEKLEPILLENPSRFTIFPLKYHSLWDLYKKAQMSNWTAEEIDLSGDMDDWVSLKDGERHFISHILAFFAASMASCLRTSPSTLPRRYRSPRLARSMPTRSTTRWSTETYSKLIDKYIQDPVEKDRTRAVETIPCVGSKAGRCSGSTTNSFATRLVAFAC